VNNHNGRHARLGHTATGAAAALAAVGGLTQAFDAGAVVHHALLTVG